jgi:hypothetical protein
MNKNKFAYAFALCIFSILFLYSANAAFAGTADLQWGKNTEADFGGYKIYYGTTPRTDKCPVGGYTGKIDVGPSATPDNPQYKLENLAEGQTFYFSITSYDKSNNESCFSDEMSQKISKFFKNIWQDLINLFGKK